MTVIGIFGSFGSFLYGMALFIVGGEFSAIKIIRKGLQWCNGLRHAFNISPLRSQVQSPVLADDNP
jgi:hypothetical protein